MRVAIVAGYGELPVMSAVSLKARGDYVLVIAIKESCNNIERLKEIADSVYIFSVGQVGKMFKTFYKEKITNALLIGKVEINLLEQGVKFDLRALWLIAKLSVRSTDTISMMAVQALKEQGITTLSQREVLQNYIPEAQIFSKRLPDERILEDISFGYSVAKGIGEIDMGQSVVVACGKVMAIESAEGTDKTFARGCLISNRNGVAVKVAKPLQDNRFDLPTIGIDTLSNVVKNGGATLAFEAGETIVVNLDECTKFADEHNIVFMAVKYNQPQPSLN